MYLLQLLSNKNNFSIIGFGSLFILVHGWLFLKYQQWLVLGFDTGFYRRYILEPLTSIPHASVPGLDHTVIIPRVFMDLVRMTGLSTDVILYGSYLLAVIMLLTSFYFWVKEIFTDKVAYWAVILLLLSPVYFHAYWFFLFKNFLALALLFCLLIAIRRKAWWVVVVISLALPITHQSTVVIAGVMIFIYAILNWWRKKDFWLPLSSWFLLMLIYLIYHPNISDKLASTPKAIFIDWPNFIQMVWPLFILAGAGLWFIRSKIFERVDLVAWVIVVLSFLVFTLPYYERVFFFAIFPLSILGAVFLVQLNKKILTAIVVLLIFVWVYMMNSYEPYFPQIESNNLHHLEKLSVTDNVITPNFMSPWVHGYTLAEVYSPGVFKDPYSPSDWELYWSHTEPSFNQAFLDAYPQPLYFYIPSGQEYFLPNKNCVEVVEDALYRYTCYNKFHE